MAKYRFVYTTFWLAKNVRKVLDDDGKLLYLYFLTNHHGKQCGITEYDEDVIALELEWPKEKVLKVIDQLEKMDKVKYNRTTGEIAIHRWLQYNGGTSPNVRKGILGELGFVKDKSLIDYVQDDARSFLPATQALQGRLTIGRQTIEVKDKTKTIQETSLTGGVGGGGGSSPIPDRPPVGWIPSTPDGRFDQKAATQAVFAQLMREEEEMKLRAQGETVQANGGTVDPPTAEDPATSDAPDGT